MRLPRGTASIMLSLSAGSITIIAVGVGAVPVVREASMQGYLAHAAHLTVVGRLTVDRLGTGNVHEVLPALQERSKVQALLYVSENGVVASAPPGGSFELYPVLQQCDLPSVFAGNINTTTVIAEPDGGFQQAACLPAGPQHAIAVVGGASYLQPLLERERRTRRLLVMLGGLAGLVVMFGVLMVTAPIAEIADAAHRIGAGERDVRVEPRGPGEIVSVALAINALARGMEAKEDEIETRLAVVSEITGMVAHEVRNPLHSLSLLVSLAASETDEARRADILSKIEREIGSMEAIVQRLLRESGPLRVSRGPADIGVLANQALDVAQAQARSRGVTVRAKVPRKLRGSVDSSLVRRSLENLLLNAVEWARDNGTVQLTVTDRGDDVELVVDDDGPGVPVVERDEVFRPYFSAKPGGTGLGLSLVRQVFESHGGTIRCEASPSGGARFIATLPKGTKS